MRIQQCFATLLVLPGLQGDGYFSAVPFMQAAVPGAPGLLHAARGTRAQVRRQEVRPVTVDAVFFSYAQRSMAVRCAQARVVLYRPDMHFRVFKTLARWLAAHAVSGISLYLCARWQCPKLHRAAVMDAYARSVRILGEGSNVIIAYFASCGGGYQKTCLA